MKAYAGPSPAGIDLFRIFSRNRADDAIGAAG